MKNKKLFLLVAIILIVFLPACKYLPSYQYQLTQTAEARDETKSEDSEPDTPEVPTGTPIPILTDTPIPLPTNTPLIPLGSEENPIVWVIYQWNENETFYNAVDQAVELLKERTGYAVEVKFSRSYSDVIGMLCNGDAHIGDLNALSFLSANKNGCAEAAFIMQKFGAISYKSEILVSADSGYTSIADLPGATFCRASENSVSSWIIPRLMMLAEGIDPEKDLLGIIDVGTHQDVIKGLYDGVCDVGGVYQNARSDFSDDFSDIFSNTLKIAESVSIPLDTISFSSILPLETREELTSFFSFIELYNSGQLLRDLYNAGGLYEGGDDLYNDLRILVEAAGVDVDSYFE